MSDDVAAYRKIIISYSDLRRVKSKLDLLDELNHHRKVYYERTFRARHPNPWMFWRYY